MSSKSWTTPKVNTQNERENAAVKSYAMCKSVSVCVSVSVCGCALTNPNNLSTIYGIKLKIRRLDQRRTEPNPAWKWSMAQTKTPGKCFVWLFFGCSYCCCCCHCYCCCCCCCCCLLSVSNPCRTPSRHSSRLSAFIWHKSNTLRRLVCVRMCVCVCV